MHAKFKIPDKEDKRGSGFIYKDPVTSGDAAGCLSRRLRCLGFMCPKPKIRLKVPEAKRIENRLQIQARRSFAVRSGHAMSRGQLYTGAILQKKLPA